LYYIAFSKNRTLFNYGGFYDFGFVMKPQHLEGRLEVVVSIKSVCIG